MSLEPVYTVRDARAQLPALIASTREGHMPVLGSRRLPEAALVPAGILDVLDLMLHGMARDEAKLFSDARDKVALNRGDVIHPGDSMGKVIAWLWRAGQTFRLTEFVATFVLTMREHYDAPKPRLRFSDVLDGIPMALPENFPDSEVGPLLEHLRTAVPRQFATHPDEP